MRDAKYGTTHAGRRRPARSENNDGRILSCEDGQDCEVVAEPPNESRAALEWLRGSGLQRKGGVEHPSTPSHLHTIPLSSTIWIYRFGARLVSFSIRLLGAGQWISSSSICAAAPMPKTSRTSCEERDTNRSII